jgi:hypothetical protein
MTWEEILNSLNDPNSWMSQRFSAAEAAAADQNQFNRGITQGGLDVNRQQADTQRYSAETGRQVAGADAAYKKALIKQAAEELAFKYHQQSQTNEIEQGKLAVSEGQLGLGTLQLGAGLRGPRDWDQYLETAAAAGGDPMLQKALGSWSSLTNPRPNTGAVGGPLPQRFDLNALVSDFTGGVGQGRAQTRDANLDAVAMGQAPAPGWWQGMSGDEQDRSLGYWETRGFSPRSVLNSLAYQQIGQGLGYGGS